MLQQNHPSIEELRTLPLFEGISDNVLMAILSGLYVKTFGKKKLLYVQGNRIDTCYIVLDGAVKIFLESANGSESILGIATKGDILGDAAILENARFPTSAQTAEKVTVITIPVSVFRHLVEGNKQIASNLLVSFSGLMTKLFKQIQQNTALTASQRLGCFLLELYKKQSNSNSKTIELPYAKQLIAAQLQMTPETFSRAMCELKNHGLHFERSIVYIDDVTGLSEFSYGNQVD